MPKYILRRLFTLLPILFGVSLVVFVIMRAIPGDIAILKERKNPAKRPI